MLPCTLTSTNSQKLRVGKDTSLLDVLRHHAVVYNSSAIFSSVNAVHPSSISSLWSHSCYFLNVRFVHWSDLGFSTVKLVRKRHLLSPFLQRFKFFRLCRVRKLCAFFLHIVPFPSFLMSFILSSFSLTHITQELYSVYIIVHSGRNEVYLDKSQFKI